MKAVKYLAVVLFTVISLASLVPNTSLAQSSDFVAVRTIT